MRILRKTNKSFYVNIFLILIIVFFTASFLNRNYQENIKEINLTQVSVEFNLNQIKDILENNDIEKIYLDKYYVRSILLTSMYIEKNLSSNIWDKLFEIDREFVAFVFSYKNEDFVNAENNIDTVINKINTLLSDYEKFVDECFNDEVNETPKLKYIFVFRDINKFKLQYFK